MRILHTSDWHIGRRFGQHALLDDQAAVLAWLAEVVGSEGIDMVVVSGDLFDRPVPAADAVEVLGDGIRALVATGATVVAIAGNHDSATRVAAYDGLTDAAGLVIRGGFTRAGVPFDVTRAGETVSVVCIPYLDPAMAARAALEGDGAPTSRAAVLPTHEAVIGAALARARGQVAPQRTVVLAHAFVTGAYPSDSERDISVGTAGMVSADLFDGFAYTALGHLHRPQWVGRSGSIRYSGSPLPYSFSETHAKSVTIAELSDRGVDAEELAVPVGRRVHTVRGSFDDILGDVALDEHVEAFLRVELTDHTAVLDAARRLRERFPHLVEIARVAEVRRAPGSHIPAGLPRSAPRQVIDLFWAACVGTPIDDESGSIVDSALATVAAGEVE